MSKDVFPIGDARFNSMDVDLERVIKDLNVPGMAVVIVEDDQVIFSKGYGYRNVEEKIGIDSDTIFGIGSSSKAFATMSMAILVDQGKLDWDKPLRNYLPTFKLYDPFASERMTPRDLVCHRSGLPRHDLSWYNSPLSRKEIFSRLQYLEPSKDFRTFWQYQNLMYMTAGVLVEEITGLTWEDFTQREVFDRLGMARSSFSVEKSKNSDNFALPYREEEEQFKQIPFRNLDNLAPAGSINSCLKDMSSWLRLHLNGQVGGVEIVSKAQIDEMHAPNMLIPPSFGGMEDVKELSHGSYGLGWFTQYYRGRRFVHHGGNIDGFSTLVSFLPDDKKGIVVLTNMNGTPATWATTLTVYDRLLGAETKDWTARYVEARRKAKEAMSKSKEKTESKKVSGTKPTHDLSCYVGEYENPGYGILTVSLEDGQLKGCYNNISYNLEHYHYDYFTGSAPETIATSLKVCFHIDPQGNIYKLTVPFQPDVKDIEFMKQPDKSMKSHDFLQKFIGKYQINGKQGKVAFNADHSLVLAIPGSPDLELEPYQGTEFSVKGKPVIHIEFIVDDSGEVTGLDLTQPGAVLNVKKVE